MKTKSNHKQPLLLVLSLLICCCKVYADSSPLNKKVLTTITIHFQKPPKSTQLDTYVFDTMNLKDYQRIYRRKISNNTYVFKTYLDHPVEVGFMNDYSFCLYSDSLSYYQSNVTMVEPGDQVELQVGSEFVKGILNIEFSGRGSDKFRMLQEQIKAVNCRPHISPFKLSPQKQFMVADTDRVIGQSILGKYKNKISNAAFVYYRTQWLVDNYYVRFSKFGKVLTQHAELFSNLPIIKKEFTFKSSLYGIESISFLRLMADLEYGLKQHMNIAQNYTKTNLWQHYQNVKNAYNDNMQQFLCSWTIVNRINVTGNDEQMQKCIADYFSTDWKDKSQKKVVQNLVADYNQKMGGQKNILPFKLKDTTGKEYTLDRFKNEILVVDFFFYGCGGCYTTRRYLDSLEKMYRGQPVKFIAVSIDKDLSTWKKGIGTFSSKAALQLYTNGLGAEDPFIKYYQIFSYPTLMIVDKTSRVISARAPDIRIKEGWRQMNEMLKIQLNR